MKVSLLLFILTIAVILLASSKEYELDYAQQEFNQVEVEQDNFDFYLEEGTKLKEQSQEDFDITFDYFEMVNTAEGNQELTPLLIPLSSPKVKQMFGTLTLDDGSITVIPIRRLDTIGRRIVLTPLFTIID